MKLFAIYVGGEHPGANIEVHDMRFVVAETLADTHDRLRAQWWGAPESLHIDCWAEITAADGYKVFLSSEPFAGPERLYYVNLGGYDRRAFIEQHRNVFVVAKDLPAAKARAITMATGWKDAHRDEIYEAEQAFSLDTDVQARGLHIHLKPLGLSAQPAFQCRYTPLRRG
ncbi:DUF1543 domain-containing protein [Brevundimonas sp.]|jgi:hypothetical protein|uniref:DUF1543 domain-containing protein n=1 Tax=Brevundimonas sp. TaxID=1871086 RepID=UPI002EDB9EAD